MKWFSLFVWVLVSGCASGGTIFVQSLGALGWNDQVPWSQFAMGANEPSPLTAQSIDGLGVTASNTEAFTIYQEHTSPWEGNFTVGDVILGQQFSDIGSANDPVTLTFASPVYGAGFQVEPAYYGDFTVQLSVYDASNDLLGSDIFSGVSQNSGDGSAIFIGALDNFPEISYVTVQMITEGGNPATAGLGIDTLFLNEVPEPASFALVALALSGLGTWRRLSRT